MWVSRAARHAARGGVARLVKHPVARSTLTRPFSSAAAGGGDGKNGPKGKGKSSADALASALLSRPSGASKTALPTGSSRTPQNTSQSMGHSGPATLILRGIAEGTDEDDILQLCREKGLDVFLPIWFDSSSGQCAVRFENSEAASHALEVLQGAMLATESGDGTVLSAELTKAHPLNEEPLVRENDGNAVLRLDVLPNMVGSVIGRAGKGLKSICDDTGAVYISFTNAADRCFVVGTPEAAQAAAAIIHDRAGVPAGEESRRLQAPKWLTTAIAAVVRAGSEARVVRQVYDDVYIVGNPAALEAASVLLSASVPPNLPETRLPCPSGDIAGRIIGPRGATLKRIIAQSGANISYNNDLAEFHLTGPAKAVAAAEEMIRSEMDSKTRPPGRKSAAAPASDEKVVECTYPYHLRKKLIGAKGNTQKQIMSDSGVRSLSFPDDEPGVCVLVGSSEAVTAASEIIALKIAALSGDENATVTQSDLTSEEVAVPADAVGFLIGKGGGAIRDIGTQSGATVNVDADSGVCRVLGQPAAVSAAVDLITTRLQNFSVGGKSSAQGSTRKIECPPGAAGFLIGPGGSSIKEVVKRSGAFVNIDDKASAVIVSGTPDSINAAVLLIEKRLAAFSAQESQGRRELSDGRILQRVSYPAGTTGLLIGRGGADIQKMIDKTGAQFNFDADDSVCTVTGQPAAVDSAVAMLESRVAELNAEIDSKRRGDSGAGRQAVAGPDEVKEVIPIAAEVRGGIIGAGGSELRRVASESGTRVVQLPRDQPEGVVLIGSPSSVATAREMIISKAASLQRRGRAGRSGQKGRDEDSIASRIPNVFMTPPPPFEMNLHSEARQLVLKTGAVPLHRVGEVRAMLAAHSDFSDELKRVDRRASPADAYFLRLVAAGLAKNPDMSIADKRDIVRAMRQTLAEHPDVENDSTMSGAV